MMVQIGALLRGHPQLVLASFAASGVLVMVWGLPRANRHRLPWRWRVGIAYIGLSLILWPLFYFFSARFHLEILWIAAPFLTITTFGVGLKRLIWADKWDPGRYDFGWGMRPRAENGSGEEVARDLIEDTFNPLAAIVRRRRLPKNLRSGS